MAFAAYSLLSFGDASVKSLGKVASLFQIGFVIALISSLCLPLLKTRGCGWRESFTPARPGLVFLRALTGIGASLLGFYAFISIPLTEAYALIFLAPLFTTLIALLVLGEVVRGRALVVLVLGFTGVLMVVQPGLSPLSLGHLAALGTAILMACTITILRAIAGGEQRCALLGVQMFTALIFYGAVLIVTGDFRTLAAEEWARLLAAGGFSTLGQVALIVAASLAPASRTAPAQYGQLVWAAAIGGIIFGEALDAMKLAGIGVLLITGTLAFRSARERSA